MPRFDDRHIESMRRSAAKRRRYGHRPAPEARNRTARLVGSFKRDIITWELYEFLPTGDGDNLKGHIDHGGQWSNHKLIALPSRQGKANYWFAYNHADARFSKSEHVMALLDTEPEVYAWVLATIDPETFGGLV